MADFRVDTDGDVRIQRVVPDGTLELILNPDGVAVNRFDDEGEVVAETWYTYDDLDPGV